MDPADGIHFAGQPHLTDNEPMNDFDFDIGSISHYAAQVPNEGDLDDTVNTNDLDWNLYPNDAFPQPLQFNDYQGFATQPYQDRFAHSLPTLPEKRLYEVDGFSPLSTQTSNETLTTSDQHPRRRSIRKRRIENGYHCSEPHCQEAFDTAGELTKHCYRKHTPESAWPFACPTCGKRFYDKRDYRRHEDVERKRASAMASVRRSVPGSPKHVDNTVDDKNNDDNVGNLSSRRPSQITAQLAEPDEHHDTVKTSLHFTRANDQHVSSADLLEAATSDLKSFINLGASHITIRATVSSQRESMNISSSHTLKTTMLGTELKKGAKPSATHSSTHPAMSEADRMEAKVAANVSSLNHPTTSTPISRAKKPPQPAQAVTLTFRSRPAFPRSLTHPVGMSMVGVGCC